MGLRPRARFARAWSSAIICNWTLQKKIIKRNKTKTNRKKYMTFSMENILKCIYTISNRGLLDAMFWIMHLWKRLRLGCCRVLLISTYHFLTNAPSTRIRIFLNPQLFLSGFKNFHVRVQIEFARSRVSDTFRGFTPVPRTALGILTTCVVKRAKFASRSAFHGKELGLIWLRIKRLHDSDS